MLFMNICTWKPENNTEVVARRSGWSWPKESKVIFEFIDLQGCRYINVIDSDVYGLIATRAGWVDLVSHETFPVYPVGVSKDQFKMK